jgi:hypothetical protein
LMFILLTSLFTVSTSVGLKSNSVLCCVLFLIFNILGWLFPSKSWITINLLRYYECMKYCQGTLIHYWKQNAVGHGCIKSALHATKIKWPRGLQIVYISYWKWTIHNVGSIDLGYPWSRVVKCRENKSSASFKK